MPVPAPLLRSAMIFCFRSFSSFVFASKARQRSQAASDFLFLRLLWKRAQREPLLPLILILLI